MAKGSKDVNRGIKTVSEGTAKSAPKEYDLVELQIRLRSWLKDVGQNLKDKDAAELVAIINALNIEAKKKDQSAGLPEQASLEDRINALLAQEGLPSGKQAKLQRQFMAEVIRAKKDTTTPELQLPQKAPELWKSGQGETALQFMRRVYQDYLEAGVLTWKWLKEHDQKLARTLNSTISQKQNLDDNVSLPLTESDIFDLEYKDAVACYGQAEVERIFRLQNTMNKRASRENKKFAGEESATPKDHD